MKRERELPGVYCIFFDKRERERERGRGEGEEGTEGGSEYKMDKEKQMTHPAAHWQDAVLTLP